VQREDAVERPDDRDVLAVVEREAPDRRPARALQRRVQQPIGVLGLLTRTDEVRLLIEDRIDVGRADEVVDLDDVARAPRRRLDLVLLQDHVLARGDLVALHDLLVGDLLVLLRAEPPVLDARPVLEVNLVEVDRLGLRRRVQLHRDMHDPDGQRPVPDRPRHRGAHPNFRGAGTAMSTGPRTIPLRAEPSS
jgi:hypothetical protein